MSGNARNFQTIFEVELICPLRVMGVQLNVHEGIWGFSPLKELFYPDPDQDDAA